jgi:hypothetical protein
MNSSVLLKRDQLVVSDDENTQCVYGDISHYCKNFKVGISLLSIDANRKAQNYFQLAYESVNYSDLYHNVYASYCGLSRVLNGDRLALQLCREAARNEMHNADVLLNLARAEWHLKHRMNSIAALNQGLKIDDKHPGIHKMKQEIGVRKRKIFPILDRSNPLNNSLGKLFRTKNL